jgi:sulfotransferase family protein
MTAGTRARKALRRLAGRPQAPADRTPPPCPPGWRVAPPDFVGVGVQRGGTSWWFDELSKHPDVYLPPDRPKELHFFDGFSDRKLTDADIQRYHAWFPRPDGGRSGEWTPSYLYEPWSVPMLARAAPDARFLVMLRDPMDRFRSALMFELRRDVSHPEAVLDAYHRGLYSNQIARLQQYAPPERVLVLTYEAARADTTATLRDTAAFVGLDADRTPVPEEAKRPHNRKVRVAQTLSEELLAELEARYRDDIAALAKLVPDVDFGRWPTAG